MKDISKQIKELTKAISENKDPKPFIKKMDIHEREKYVINGESLRLLMILMVNFYNIIGMGDLFE